MVPAEKISTIPMMTEANQPQLSRPIMHMKPVPMTASVATAKPSLNHRGCSNSSLRGCSNSSVFVSFNNQIVNQLWRHYLFATK